MQKSHLLMTLFLSLVLLGFSAEGNRGTTAAPDNPSPRQVEEALPQAGGGFCDVAFTQRLPRLADGMWSVPTVGPTTRVSIRSGGGEANGESFAPDMSADGRYIVFESDADNLVDNDHNNVRDIFVHDRSTGVTQRVSVRTGGQEGNFDSCAPAISDDGRIVVFHSYATNLVDGDTNNVPDVFFHNRETGNTRLVSVGLGGFPANDVSYEPDISADGRYVAFWSYASNLVGGDGNNKADVFRYDRQDGVMLRLSVDSNGVEGNGDSRKPVISADGQRIAFESHASNLVTGDGNGYKDIFLRNVNTGRTLRISLTDGEGEANGESFDAAISGNGLFVAFVSLATNLIAGDNNNNPDVFIRDRDADSTHLVSVATNGGQADNWSEEPAVSADGRYVAFQTYAALVDGDHNGSRDVFVRDRQSNTTLLASVDSGGVIGNASSREPVISGDGRYVVFSSKATNLVGGDGNNSRDIFVKDVLGPPPPPPAPRLTTNHTIGAPGSIFGFTGSHFTPDTVATVWINGSPYGTVTIDSDGSLSFQLLTNPSTAPGGYYVAAIDTAQRQAAVTVFLAVGAPIHPGTPGGEFIIVPDGIAYGRLLYLPVASPGR